ncbi:MAG: GNAT family N-acetyltransferase [Melioribacteraceae bacterium]|nr:GNAT family N-acetyltransferase [Melioribacteraceae bacterium]
MDNVVIKSIANSQRKKFLKLAFEIYSNDPYWVPPLFSDKMKVLSREKNPFFHENDLELFIAYKNGKPAGRIAAIENKLHNKIHKENIGFIGFFESVNDQEVADKLFDAAAGWMKRKGFDSMRGPTNPTSNDEYGLLVDGFNDSPRIMMSYNPKYYVNLFENYGFTKAKDLYAYHIQNQEMLKNEKIKRVAEIVRDRYKLNIRSVDMKNFKKELGLFKYVYNKTWAPNWGFIPMSDEEIDAAASDLKPLIDPNLVLFGEISGEIIATALVLPDYNEIFKSFRGRLFPFNFIRIFTKNKDITWARVIALGVLPEYQKKGIDGALYYDILKRAAERGIMRGEASWILEDNEMMNRGAITMNGNIYKKYRIYQKAI